jgi:O-antigen/teichoic acid export membrane protein
MYYQNTAWLMFDNIIRLISTLTIGLYVARYLGPSNYGALSYAISFSGVFTLVVKQGLDGIIVRDIVKQPNSKNELLGALFTVKAIGWVVMLLLLLISLIFVKHDQQINRMIYIITASAIISIYFDVINVNYQAEVRAKYIVIIKSVQLTVSSILKLFAVFQHASVIWFAVILLCDAIALSTGAIYVYLKFSGKPSEWLPNYSVIKRVLKDGWPALLAAYAGIIYMQIDQVMIGGMLGHKELGIYSVATRLSMFWYFIPMIIVTSIMPAIVKARSYNKEQFLEKIQRLHDLLFLLALGIAIITTIFSEDLIIILYGNEYARAASVLDLHIWAGIFVFLGTAGAKWYMVENLLMLSLGRHIIGMITNVMLNIYLIPEYGIRGAAIATLVSYMISSYIYDIFDSRSRVLFRIKSKSMLLMGFNLLRYIMKKQENITN